ncbi:MAG: hypothetical protein U1F30_01215 [Steroidobacteraceae bacterium]
MIHFKDVRGHWLHPVLPRIKKPCSRPIPAGMRRHARIRGGHPD